MKLADPAREHRKLRAPVDDGAVLVEPPADEIRFLLRSNAARLSGQDVAGSEPRFADFDCQGRTLGDLTAAARRDVLEAGIAYTRQYRDFQFDATRLDRQRQPIVMAGHQPEIFHPGVWCKNFGAGRIAEQFSGVAVNLLVNSDVVKHTAVRVPAGTVDRPFSESVPLDQPGGGIPFEEYRIRDHETFADFGRRASEIISQLVASPLLDRYWPMARGRAKETDNLGACLAQARHQLEGDWGLKTLELPQSTVCSIEPFFWFAAHILAHLPRFFEIYNSSLASHRTLNRVRSRAHPVPDLESEDGWLEAPFWIWTTSDPRRRRLFVRPSGDELVLTDRERWQTRLQLAADDDASRAVEQLAVLSAGHVKIRTRALLTTMFARLCLCDLFVHGIGGAKYDQLTDEIIRRFFGFPAPAFVTLSATLRLPVAATPTSAEQLSATDRQLRELHWNPDVFLLNSPQPVDGRLREWVEEKRHWIAEEPTVGKARQRFLAIREANEAMRAWVVEEESRLLQQRESARAALRRESILASREYAFCLHSEEKLRGLLLDNLHRWL